MSRRDELRMRNRGYGMGYGPYSGGYGYGGYGMGYG